MSAARHMGRGIGWKDMIQPQNVPPGYLYHTGSPGMYIAVLCLRMIVLSHRWYAQQKWNW